jgi:predicted RNA-binding protein with TRAM domain
MSYEQRGGGYGARRGFGSPRSFARKPVKVGEEYDVEIAEVSRRGDGIARVQGLVIFVAGAKAGQKVKVRIVRVTNRYATAEIVPSTPNAPSQPAKAPASASPESGGKAQ